MLEEYITSLEKQDKSPIAERVCDSFSYAGFKPPIGKADADVFQNAKIYLIGSCISYPFIGIFEAVCGSLRGVGETKPCLTLSLLLNLTNHFSKCRVHYHLSYGSSRTCNFHPSGKIARNGCVSNLYH